MVFTKEELKAIEAFEKEHGNCYKGSGKPLNFLIRQNWGSGIGVNVYITCGCCGKEKDVTDYLAWLKYIVYKHTSPSGKCYIGITKTTLNKRSGKNGQYYCRGKQPLFQNAIKKYGWNSFKHEVLFSNLSKEKAELFEQKLIYFYKLIGRSYNLAKGGLGGNRECLSKEEIRKLKERCNKPISVYNLNGDLLYQFGSITETSNFLNIPLSSVSCCLLRNIQYKNLYQFKYTNSLFTVSKICKRKEILSVKQLTLEGNLVKIYSSAYEACKETGIDYSNIIKCCKHKKGYNQCKGYKWEYNI